MNSLIISNKIPSFFHFGFVWEVTDNIHFEYFHGKLKSGITDDYYSINYYNKKLYLQWGVFIRDVFCY